MYKISGMIVSLFLILISVSGMDSVENSYWGNDKISLNGNLKITVQPAAQADCKENKVTFSVVSEGGTGKIHYLWKRKRPTDAVFASFGAADSLKLPVYNIGVGKEAPDGTLYQVTVSDQSGMLISEVATLTVNEITGIFPSGVASYTVNEGSNLSFSVLTSGNIPLSYQWIKKFGNNDWRNLVDNQIISGSQGIQLNFTKISLADSGIYKVRVSFPTVMENQCSETSSITRTIHVKQVADTVPPNFVGLTNRNLTLCPEDIEQAAWDESSGDILPPRTNFYRLQKYSSLFDLSETNFHDNVTSPSKLILHWGIWSAVTPFNPVADEDGTILDDMTGQVSLHTAGIYFGSSGNNAKTCRIIFWLEDEAGNLTPEQLRHQIEVSTSLRPQIVSKF